MDALSTSPSARDWLIHNPTARVLHVFDRACNLISSDGRLISLVTQEIGEGPFNLVLSPVWFSPTNLGFSPFDLALPPIWLTSCVTAESNAKYQKGMLRVGRLAVDTTHAQVWDPRPDWYGLRRQVHRIRSKAPLLTDILRALAPKGGLAEMVVLQPDSAPPSEKGVFRPARPSIDKFIEGLHGADASLCGQAASELAGCGDGLTPEGDDFMLGCLLGIRLLYEDNSADGLADLIIDAIAGQTTILSTEWLRSAARGECAWPWHTLLESLPQDRPELIEAAARTIIMQGHTSGSAALAGFIAVMQPNC